MQSSKQTRLFEVEQLGVYHEHWLAGSHLDAARRAVTHAGEIGVTLDRLDVSTMSLPEDRGKGGIVYVANDTRTYAVTHGRLRRVDPSDEQGARSQGGRP
jgi:hypothetical protein